MSPTVPTLYWGPLFLETPIQWLFGTKSLRETMWNKHTRREPVMRISACLGRLESNFTSVCRVMVTEGSHQSSMPLQFDISTKHALSPPQSGVPALARKGTRYQTRLRRPDPATADA